MASASPADVAGIEPSVWISSQTHASRDTPGDEYSAPVIAAYAASVMGTARRHREQLAVADRRGVPHAFHPQQRPLVEHRDHGFGSHAPTEASARRNG